MFKITQFKGFSITFPNGCRLSTQFGPGNYCDNYDAPMLKFLNDPSILEPSTTVETAVLKDDNFFPVWWDEKKEDWVEGSESDDVQGYITVEKWIKLVNYVSSL